MSLPQKRETSISTRFYGSARICSYYLQRDTFKKMSRSSATNGGFEDVFEGCYIELKHCSQGSSGIQ